MTLGKTSVLPPILDLAARIRDGETGQALADQYDITFDTLRNKFSRAGFSFATGHALTTDNTRQPLPGGMVGTGGQYIGGGDWNRGLPTGDRPIVHRAKPKAGLDWAAIDAEYEANGGERKPDIWDKGAKIVKGALGNRVNTYAAPAPEPELRQPPKAADAEPVAIPDGLATVDPYEALADEKYDPPETPADEPGRKPAGRPSFAFTPEQTADIIHSYKLGETTHALAERLSTPTKRVHNTTVRNTLLRAGITLRPRGRTAKDTTPPVATASPNDTTGPEASAPARHSNGRPPAFTSDETAEIIRRYKLGESASTLADSFGTTGTTVRRTLIRAGVTMRGRGARWPHIPKDETGLKLRDGDQPLPIVNDHQDIQTMVIADIEARRLTRSGRHTGDHDYLELLYHGLIDALLDVAQLRSARDSQPTGMELARQDRVRGAGTGITTDETQAV